MMIPLAMSAGQFLDTALIPAMQLGEKSSASVVRGPVLGPCQPAAMAFALSPDHGPALGLPVSLWDCIGLFRWDSVTAGYFAWRQGCRGAGMDLQQHCCR